MELREQFTLASGVSQSMTPFKSKPRGDRGESPTSSVSGDQRNGAQGPITKVSCVFLSFYPPGSLTLSKYGKWKEKKKINIVDGSLLLTFNFVLGITDAPGEI